MLFVLVVHTLVVVAEAFLAQLVEEFPRFHDSGAVVVAKVEMTAEAETGASTERTAVAAAAGVVAAAAEQIGTIIVVEVR